MPFQPSKDSESSNPNPDITLLNASSTFPSLSTLDDSPSTIRRGRSKMSRSELLSLLNDALAILDEDLDNYQGQGQSDSSSNDQ
jgi:hypothetical protein